MSHEVPPRPWSKVGSDLFELNGQHYIVLVDYYSNFIELENLDGDTTSRNVIRNIKQSVSRFGIMDILVSDNGPQYSSAEFMDFTRKYNIRHTTSSPGYPQANGLAEKSVQVVKNLIRKCLETGEDIHLALLDLRTTPRDSHMGSPMERLMGRKAQTLLPSAESLLKPASRNPETVHKGLTHYRKLQKLYYDRGVKPLSEIHPGRDGIRISTPRGWEPAEYIHQSHHNSHMVRAGGQARTYRRNRRDLRTTAEMPHMIRPIARPLRPLPRVAPPPNVIVRHPIGMNMDNAPVRQNVTVPDTQVTTRSGRQIRPPSWMKDMVK